MAKLRITKTTHTKVRRRKSQKRCPNCGKYSK